MLCWARSGIGDAKDEATSSSNCLEKPELRANARGGKRAAKEKRECGVQGCKGDGRGIILFQWDQSFCNRQAGQREKLGTDSLSFVWNSHEVSFTVCTPPTPLPSLPYTPVGGPLLFLAPFTLRSIDETRPGEETREAEHPCSSPAAQLHHSTPGKVRKKAEGNN